MLFSIRSKLLLLIGGVNTLLALVMSLLNSASVDRGFSDYLGQHVLAQQNAYVQHLQQQHVQSLRFRRFLFLDKKLLRYGFTKLTNHVP